MNQSIVYMFSDPRGWQDLDEVKIPINNFLGGRQSCYLAYSRPLNLFYLVNDAGTGTLPDIVPGAINSRSNSQCTMSPGGSFTSVSGNGNTLTLTLALSFSPSYVGNRVVYMAARDVTDTVNSGWQALGTWTVQ